MSDTIGAITTSYGKGSVGIIRLSGTNALAVASALTKLDLQSIKPRKAILARFLDQGGNVLDQGLLIYFPEPNSFTGESVIEIHAHGGIMVMHMLMERIHELGVRAAYPGEFSKRAFINGKIDLTQAEAIADLIESNSRAAVKLASRTLTGVFSQKITALVEIIKKLRISIESVIDFSDQDIDVIAIPELLQRTELLIEKLDELIKHANTGSILRDGLVIAIAGKPNVGKSSLLNQLTGQPTAIVTNIPGTTRDLIHERIEIEGLPIHLIDTAGIRDSDNPIEIEGMRRTIEALATADHILWVHDDTLQFSPDTLPIEIRNVSMLSIVRNKIDLSGRNPGNQSNPSNMELAISATLGLGINELKLHILQCIGLTNEHQGEFLARRRHVDALKQSRQHLQNAARVFHDTSLIELFAEEMRLAQNCMSEITGTYTNDDLLGEIFSTFCIGK